MHFQLASPRRRPDAAVSSTRAFKRLARRHRPGPISHSGAIPLRSTIPPCRWASENGCSAKGVDSSTANGTAPRPQPFRRDAAQERVASHYFVDHLVSRLMDTGSVESQRRRAAGPSLPSCALPALAQRVDRLLVVREERMAVELAPVSLTWPAIRDPHICGVGQEQLMDDGEADARAVAPRRTTAGVRAGRWWGR